jgi:diguanylate cyclase (GGDEF)-like protein
MKDQGAHGDSTSTLARRDTPLLPPSSGHAPFDSRATLTVLTGSQGGRLAAIEGAGLTIGSAADADLMLDEVGLSRRHARVGRAPDGGFYVEDLGSRNGTFIGAQRVALAPIHTGDRLQLGPCVRLRFAVVDAAEEALYRHLYESSSHDPLTHAFNRRYLSRRLAEVLDDVQRWQGHLGALMVDLDSFKDINDRYGHFAGDKALCAVAARIARSLRSGDLLARHGGDEFVVLTVGSDRRDTRQLAERLRRAVGELQMSARGVAVRLTASIGVASLEEIAPCDDPGAALLALADARLYGAKLSGKDCVCNDCPELRPRSRGSSR